MSKTLPDEKLHRFFFRALYGTLSVGLLYLAWHFPRGFGR